VAFENRLQIPFISVNLRGALLTGAKIENARAKVGVIGAPVIGAHFQTRRES
jgi:hypothetical protein